MMICCVDGIRFKPLPSASLHAKHDDANIAAIHDVQPKTQALLHNVSVRQRIMGQLPLPLPPISQPTWQLSLVREVITPAVLSCLHGVTAEVTTETKLRGDIHP